MIKMKKVNLFLVLAATVLFFSFVTNKEKEYDKQLVGIWKGFEVDKQYEGVEKHWIQQRFENGTYMIMFTAKEDCDIKTFTEKGKWWTKDGKFYELVEGSKDTDVYNYQVKSPEVIEFKSIELLGKKNDTYIFSDYKIDLD
jgi:hypothetical protein